MDGGRITVTQSFDFNTLLDVDDGLAEAFEQELNDAEWASYGRSVHLLMLSDHFMTAISIAVLSSSGAKEAARKLRTFLSTGRIVN